MTYDRTYLLYAAILKGRKKQTSLDRFILKRPAGESEESVTKEARGMVKKKMIKQSEKRCKKKTKKTHN